jgi:hypothetical protein
MSTMCVNPEFSQIVLKYFWDTANNRANKVRSKEICEKLSGKRK